MSERSARTRFNNDLRYREGDDPNQVAVTPEYLIGPVRKLMGGIGLDPCTTPGNPLKADSFYSLPTDGLSQPWEARTIYVNPPYGKAREPWVERCVREALDTGKRIVLLIPAATDTKTFQLASRSATSVLFVKGRLKFDLLRPNRRRVAASHPSAVFGFNVDLSPLHALGLVMVTHKVSSI